ncbi:MAG: hypothetical protein O7H41_13360 [Planctomycetota bacterium]|nr:hypothetical protein [Planctomycetota bacterium]
MSRALRLGICPRGVSLPRSDSQIDTVILALGKGPELEGHANVAWLGPRAQEVTLAGSGFLNGQQILLHDQGSKSRGRFRKIPPSAGVTPLRLPPRRQPEAVRLGGGRAELGHGADHDDDRGRISSPLQ